MTWLILWVRVISSFTWLIRIHIWPNPVITHLGKPTNPNHLNTSAPYRLFVHFFLSCLRILSSLRSLLYTHFSVIMDETSSDNPEVARALKTVTQNMLSSAFQVGEIDTQPRWAWHQTVYDVANSDCFRVNVNVLSIPRTRRTIPATIRPRITVLLGVYTHVNPVHSILLTPLLTLASNMKPRMMVVIAIKSGRDSPLSKSNIRYTVCSD